MNRLPESVHLGYIIKTGDGSQHLHCSFHYRLVIGPNPNSPFRQKDHLGLDIFTRPFFLPEETR